MSIKTKKVALYIQGMVDDAQVRRVAIKMAEMYGGSTSLDGYSYWDGPGGIEEECISYVFSFTTKQGMDLTKGKLKTLALEVGREQGQQEVAVELDGKLEILEVEEE